MLGYDVEIFEANGEKTISTSYPNIYILLTNGVAWIKYVRMTSTNKAEKYQKTDRHNAINNDCRVQFIRVSRHLDDF